MTNKIISLLLLVLSSLGYSNMSYFTSLFHKNGLELSENQPSSIDKCQLADLNVKNQRDNHLKMLEDKIYVFIPKIDHQNFSLDHLTSYYCSRLK